MPHPRRGRCGCSHHPRCSWCHRRSITPAGSSTGGGLTDTRDRSWQSTGNRTCWFRPHWPTQHVFRWSSQRRLTPLRTLFHGSWSRSRPSRARQARSRFGPGRSTGRDRRRIGLAGRWRGWSAQSSRPRWWRLGRPPARRGRCRGGQPAGTAYWARPCHRRARRDTAPSTRLPRPAPGRSHRLPPGRPASRYGSSWSQRRGRSRCTCHPAGSSHRGKDDRRSTARRSRRCRLASCRRTRRRCRHMSRLPGRPGRRCRHRGHPPAPYQRHTRLAYSARTGR